MERKYQVRKYDEKLKVSANDDVIEEFGDLVSAQQRSIYLNSKNRYGDGYYVMDFPHEPAEITKSQIESLKKRFGLRLL